MRTVQCDRSIGSSILQSTILDSLSDVRTYELQPIPSDNVFIFWIEFIDQITGIK